MSAALQYTAQPMLSAEHLKHLGSYGITESLLESARVESFSDARVRELGLGAKYPAEDLSGIFFPYHNGDAAHHRIGARVRLDNPLNDKTKYLSEPGNRHLYVPPSGYAYFSDTSIPLIFVESEKATLAVTAFMQRTNRKLLPIGIGGCWGWLRTQGKKLLAQGGTETETGPAPELDKLELKQRVAFIAFDSNAASNAHVRAGRKRFAKLLKKRNAVVRFVSIPEIEDVNGPDDLIKVAGDDALARAIDEAYEPLGRTREITIREGELPEATDLAEEILVKHAKRLGIFQRSGEVQRIIRLPENQYNSGLFRPAGTVQLDPVSEPVLMEVLERLMYFTKFKTDGTPIHVDCPSSLAVRYLRRKALRLPVLVGFVNAPVMRADGSILTASGYDELSRLFLAGDEKWLPVPATPTQQDAQNALEVLRAPFSQFPFRSNADRAVVMAVIITALQRRLLPACPLFAFSAPAPRSGKSLLAESAAIIATGKPAPASAVSRDNEEFRKALFSALREGLAVINLDNVEHALRSADLCKILTQAEFSDRLLGESTQKSFATNVLFTATGNNLMIRGDLVNRTLLCYIDPNTEKPEQREFEITDLKTYLICERAKLVQAALTILRGFYINQPMVKLPAWGGFDEWSNAVRKPLVWAGEEDPCKTREMLLEDDSEKETTLIALQQLFVGFDSGEFTAPAATEKANEKIGKTYMNQELHRALADVTGKETFTSDDLGYWMRKWNRRIVSGFRLQNLGRGHGGAKWVVKAV